MDKQTQDVLEILEQNAKATPEDISELTRIPADVVREMIRTLEAAGVIRKYKTIIDWDLIENPYVYAFVQIKVSLSAVKAIRKLPTAFANLRKLNLSASFREKIMIWNS
jgi:Transcriptional regulators